MPNYLTPTVNVGIEACVCLSNGTSIAVTWFQAYAQNPSHHIAYNIYYSSDKRMVFSEGPKFVSLGTDLAANIIDLIPGQDYYFSVRPLECDDSTFARLSALPTAHDQLKMFPGGLLAHDLTATDLAIQLVDADLFPSSGILKIGIEFINYTHADLSIATLYCDNVSDRGFLGTEARSHTTDGYDGYHYGSAEVQYFISGESKIFDRIYLCESRFEYPNFPGLIDGYHQVTKDLLHTDLSVSDDQNVTFPSYDYAGYHRTDPADLLSGNCIGSYIGGEQYCLDGYGVGRVVRGLNVQDVNNQREEELLSVTGRPAVLIQLRNTGITCACYLQSSEYADDRCPLCLGKKFVYSYKQYFNPRRSDGRIMVRVGPVNENLKVYDSGMESELPADMWTLTVPTIYNRDIIVLFDLAGNEEYRYEVMAVGRNNTFLGMEGGQKFATTRIRKTDPAYQIPIFKDTSKIPKTVTTTISSVTGILPHTHTIVTNESSNLLFTQMSSVSQGHNHPVEVVNGTITMLPALNHTHQILF